MPIPGVHPTCRCLINHTVKPPAADDNATRAFFYILQHEQELQCLLGQLLGLFTTPMPELVGNYNHHRRAL